MSAELARRFAEGVLGAGDMALLDELVADDVVVDTGLKPEGPIRGRDEYKRVLWERLGQGFSGGSMSVDEVAELKDGRVLVRFTARARHTGAMWGAEPTGREVTFREMHLMRWEDGRLRENTVGGLNPLEWEMIFAPQITAALFGKEAGLMRPITYERAADPRAAVRAGAVQAPSHVGAPVQYLAGGTQLLDLMKLDVMAPAKLVDITRIDDPRMRRIEATRDGLRLGALVTMREAAEHRDVVRDYPAVSQSLWLGASQQIRNMGRLGGNVLQRTRCEYFRDTSWRCNKRNPGEGCDALGGVNRWHAVLGVSEHCIASYPGDWAISLIALDATVDVLGAGGPRTIPFAELHRAWGDTPHIETNLTPGDLIVSFFVPAGRHTRRSLYQKVRDRESYEFGLATAAVALDLDGERVRSARIGVGGPVARPWRAKTAENMLRGQELTEANALAAAKTVFADARPREGNAFRVPLAEQTIVRALMAAKAMEV